MTVEAGLQQVRDHWGRRGLGEAILAALAESRGSLEALSLDDLAPFDQFHGGGRRLTVQQARRAGLKPGQRVLDAGGGLGGAARTLAAEFGCRVTVLDLTEDYVRAGRQLTVLLRLEDQITFQVGNALDLPFSGAAFDVVWTQNSGMNIAAKEQLYAGFERVLRPGGRLAIQEVMAGPNQPPVFPVMWSRDGAHHFARPPAEMRRLIEAAGFQTRQWVDVTLEKEAPRAARPEHTVQSLVMGAELLDEIARAARRNEAEQRLVLFQAVFDKAAFRAAG